MFTFRKKHFLVATLLFIIELFIALFMHDPFIRPYFGDFLIVILLYCMLRSFLNRNILFLALSSLFFSYVVETAQYFGLIYKLNLEHSLMAHLILGSTFKWLDMLAYTLGFGVILIAEEISNTRTANSQIILKTKS